MLPLFAAAFRRGIACDNVIATTNAASKSRFAFYTNITHYSIYAIRLYIANVHVIIAQRLRRKHARASFETLDEEGRRRRTLS